MGVGGGGGSGSIVLTVDIHRHSICCPVCLVNGHVICTLPVWQYSVEDSATCFDQTEAEKSGRVTGY